MENRPAISIVMPLYNKEADVMRAINSALKQTVSDFELLVINDGSTDKGPELARSVADVRIRIINQVNKGVSVARNSGIGEASSDLIAFLDADDEWEPDYLETILGLRARFPDCDVFATSYYLARSGGEKRKAVLRGVRADDNEFRIENYFEIAAQSDPPLWTSAVAVSKKALLSVGGFPPGVTAGEDLLTWTRLALRNDIAYCNIAKAFFWEPVVISDRPGRAPQDPDVVGNELQRLLDDKTTLQTVGFRNYVGLWFRMRGVIFLQLARRRDAIRELQKSLQYSGFDMKIMTLLLIASLPAAVSKRLFSALKALRGR
jgi:glycosyltransferase involved in cell wall biosynthesis